MKHTINKYTTAANGDNVQKIVEQLHEQAIKDNPEMTAEQWQMLKCFALAGAMAMIERGEIGG